jgi:hypothetical protein
MENHVNIYFDVDFERQSLIRVRGGCHEVTGGAPFQPASLHFLSHHRIDQRELHVFSLAWTAYD